MALRDKGTKVNLKWKKDDELLELVKGAVVSLYNKKQYGPRNRDRVSFRASELGHLMTVRTPKDELDGCARRVWFDFFPEKFGAKSFDADAIMNFARGDEEEVTMENYFTEAELIENAIEQTQVKLGAWGDPDDENVPEYFRGDARFPDRSDGLIRGKCDFYIKHPRLGTRIPLEFKTISTYGFGKVEREGPKADNSLQGLWYSWEMDTQHFAVGYRNKESGALVFFFIERDDDLCAELLRRCRWMKRLIQKEIMPPLPKGARPAEDNPKRYWGNRKAPPEAYYDRVWPCYTYASKKGTVIACPFYKTCHGEELPTKPKRLAKKAKAKGKKKSGGAVMDAA